MKPRVIVFATLLFLVAGLSVGAVFLGPSFSLGASGATAAFGKSHTSTQQATGNAIVRENALPGTNNWQIPTGRAAVTQLQAYANTTSVSP